MTDLAQKVVACCRELAGYTEEPGRTTRTFLSPAMAEVHRALGAWMGRLGMQVSVDGAGNLLGLRNAGPRRLLIGSHLDTVPNAGAYDGVLGVVTGIALIEALGDRCRNLSIEIAGFFGEEGVGSAAPFIGSRAFVKTLDGRTAGYLEFHIEQGPVLESLDLPLGIVDGIAGQSRWNVTFTGRANHAGTTPMRLRADALAAAAEWIGRVESFAASEADLVATVGSINVEPNAGNVIAGSACLSLDVRHANDEARRDAVSSLLEMANKIGGRRGVGLAHERRLDQAAVPMDSSLRDLLERSVREAGYPVHRMISGAGHDAAILAPRVPAAMLFLRSPGGVSHHPDESVVPADIDAALETGLRFIAHV